MQIKTTSEIPLHTQEDGYYGKKKPESNKYWNM